MTARTITPQVVEIDGVQFESFVVGNVAWPTREAAERAASGKPTSLADEVRTNPRLAWFLESGELDLSLPVDERGNTNVVGLVGDDDGDRA